jgi:cytochrome P450
MDANNRSRVAAMSTGFAEGITVDALWDDPYPIYARMRREAPACYVPAVGLWFITRWADVEYAAAHPGPFPASVRDSPLDRTLGGTNVLTVDGERHKPWRAPLDAALRPRLLDERAPAMIGAISERLLARFAGRGEADLMADYFEPMSCLSLARWIGLGGELDAPTLQRWFHGLATGTSNFERDPQKQAIAAATSAEIDRTLRPLFERRLSEPDETMVSLLLHAGEGNLDDRLAWLMPTLKLLLIGGLQEPGHGCGSTVYGLLSRPEQGKALAADVAGLIQRAVDEGLRWLSPIGTQTRIAGPGAVIADVEIPRGENVGLLVSSANRDEEVFGPTADEFDLFRPRRQHAGFGFGPHFCVGFHLAGIQMRVAIGLLFERLPHLRLDPERPPLVRGWEYRAPVHLPVRFDA